MAVLSIIKERERIEAALRDINDFWLKARPREIENLLLESIVMVYHGFAGRAKGKEAVIASFVNFWENAFVERFEPSDFQIDIVDNLAFISFTFEMTYTRSGDRNRSTGRDLWAMQKSGNRWLAVWRTMLDLHEAPT